MRNNKILFVVCSVVMSLLLSSCKTNVNQATEVTEYQKNNDTFIKTLSSDASYTASDFGGVSPYKYYYKVTEEAPAANKGVRPFQNSKVLVEFSIALAYTQQIIVPESKHELTVLDFTTDRPLGQVRGLQYALQEMEVGDKWEVILPWELGYGAYANGVIPAYSALKYNIKLLEITKK